MFEAALSDQVQRTEKDKVRENWLSDVRALTRDVRAPGRVGDFRYHPLAGPYTVDHVNIGEFVNVMVELRPNRPQLVFFA